MADVTCNKGMWQTFWRYKDSSLEIKMDKRQWYIRRVTDRTILGQRIPVSVEDGNAAWAHKKRRLRETVVEDSPYPPFMPNGIVRKTEKAPYDEFPEEWFLGEPVTTHVSTTGSGNTASLLQACMRKGCRAKLERLPSGLYQFTALWQPNAVYRNSRVYELMPEGHDPVCYLRQLSRDMPDDLWFRTDDRGIVVHTITAERKASSVTSTLCSTS